MDLNCGRGVRFHNGDPFTAEDVRFSFERYKGTGATLLKSKLKAVEIVNPYHIRFHLHEPWPAFMTFYGSPATGAAWDPSGSCTTSPVSSWSWRRTPSTGARRRTSNGSS
jgi:ABC-type transport system substrate-binding protein